MEPTARPLPDAVAVDGRWDNAELTFGALVGVASRVFSVVLIAVAGVLSEGVWPPLTDATSPFAAWDAQWYLAIAERGYHAEPLFHGLAGPYYDFAFFPGWPLLILVGSLFGLVPMEPVAVVLANALWVIAMMLTHRLFVGMVGVRSARRATLLLAFAPAAYVGSLAYSESLFLVAVAGYFLLRNRRVWQPLAVVVAQLSRLTGFAVTLAAGARAIASRGRDRAAVIAVAAGVLTLAAWLGFIAVLTGDPASYLLGSPSWYRSSAANAGLSSVVDGLLAPDVYFVISMAFVIALVAGSVTLIRRDLEMAVYSLVAIAATVLFAHWVNMPRHALIAIPAFAALAPRLGRRTAFVAVVLSMVGQAILVSGAIRWASFPP